MGCHRSKQIKNIHQDSCIFDANPEVRLFSSQAYFQEIGLFLAKKIIYTPKSFNCQTRFSRETNCLPFSQQIWSWIH